MAATFGRGSTTDMRPSYYLHLGAKELFLGGGMYQLDKDQLQKVRQEFFTTQSPLVKLLVVNRLKSCMEN
jgi:uncharacterized protein (DUF2461 family)